MSTLLQRIKRDPSYVVDERMNAIDLAAEIFRRGASLVRAQFRMVGVGGSPFRFCEPRVSIRHRRHLTIGRGSVVEQGAVLHCLSRDGFNVGNRVTVGKYAIVECSGVLWNLGVGFTIGDDSSVGDWSFVGCSGGVRIGRRVLMGQRVAIHSQNHRFDRVDIPIQAQGVTSDGVEIGDDCWLGSGSVILDGVTLGPGCVVAAGAVVTKSAPANSVLAGVPARVVATRGVDAER